MVANMKDVDVDYDDDDGDDYDGLWNAMADDGRWAGDGWTMCDDGRWMMVGICAMGDADDDYKGDGRWWYIKKLSCYTKVDKV